MSLYLRPTEIHSVLDKLRNAKSVEEIATGDFSEEIRRMWKTIRDINLENLENKEIINKFLEGEPAAAFKRLIALRWVGDKKWSPTVKLDIDIENEQLHFSSVYRNFCKVLLNATRRTDVCSHLLRGNAIQMILLELKSTTFRKYKGESPSKSRTAAVIIIQMEIIYNIFCENSLESEIRQELERVDYIQVLKFYVIERSIPCFSSRFSLIPQVSSQFRIPFFLLSI